MLGDAGAHLVVECLGGRDIDPGRWVGGDKLLGITALARAGAAENEGQARDFGNGGILSSKEKPCHTTRGPANEARFSSSVRLLA
jgi:hypothetical protein